MNEPNSVLGDILQLSLLAGRRRVRRGSDWVEEPLAAPQDFKHLVLTSTLASPFPVTSPLFASYAIPNNQILVVNYITLATALNDQSSLAVNYGLFREAIAYLRYVKNGVTTTLAGVGSEGICNAPIFYVFPPTVTPELALSGFSASPTAGDVRFMARLNGYLCESSLYPVFMKYQTQALTS